jgi:regulator of protease activity HflC (stomatin/prohibitin superfamily)
MTDTPMAVEVNCATGEVTERLLTTEEIAQREADAIAAEAEQVAAEAKATADATAKATLLAKLGITADEAKLLLW